MAALRFRAENSHRFPTTSTGWYMYHKSKNYNSAFAGVRNGVRLGLRIPIWAALFFYVEEAIDDFRDTRDFGSTVVASLTVCGVFSVKNRFNIPTAARSASAAVKVGLLFGILQDAIALARGRRLDYIEYLAKRWENGGMEQIINPWQAIMGRPGAHGAGEDSHRRRGRHDDEPEDYDEEDQPEDEHEEPRRRGKSGAMRKPRRAFSDEEAEEEESEEDDRRHKQLVVRKKSKKGKSSGKQVARKKRQESSESEEETPDESEEEEKPKKKAKGKSRKKETVEVLKWEPVSINDADPEFLNFVVYELGVVPKKLEKGVEKGLLLRDTQTGEYNIDRFFEKGILSVSDKKSWKKLLAQNKNDPRLFHSSHNARGGPSRRVAPSVMLIDTRPVRPLPRGHAHFKPSCDECIYYGGPCLYGFGGPGYDY
ncbi:MAG: hypothetical protein Q9182_000272 [Xanthomendoza sp. 2 TL-2023]